MAPVERDYCLITSGFQSDHDKRNGVAYSALNSSGPMLNRHKVVMVFALFAGLPWILAGASAGENPVSPPTAYHGMCDASAGVAIGEELFAVANDEDNAIRVYRVGRGEGPIDSFDFSTFLKVDPKWPETDLEGAAWLEDRIFWIGSHGRNRDGKFRASRDRFFATRVEKTAQGARLVPAGKPYGRLLDDLIADRQLKSFRLSAASKLPPKDPGALNIEGLCATPDKHLLVGFRNPIPHGRALLVPLLNPNDVVSGTRAKFGAPILLNLGGKGIRDIGFWHGKYLIVAGSYDAQGVSEVYLWKGGSAEPQRMPGIDLHGFNPEAVIVHPKNRLSFQLLSDDGTMMVDGTPCKRLPDPKQRSFRSVWVTPP